MFCKLFKFHKINYLLYLLLIYAFIINYPKKIKPKISIFLPIYNKENYLVNAIQSLQNQTLKDIEIVAVNDCSNDSSLEILTNLAKNDGRIKIVNNDKNRGLLYSRAKGILYSSGEYLLNLDPDDEIYGKDSLEYLYNQSKFYNLDIISFYVNQKKGNSIIKCNAKNQILQRQYLFSSIFSYKHIITDYLIWNKLHRYAKSKKCVDKLVYIYNNNMDSLMNKRYGFIQFQNLIYRHEMYEKIINSIKCLQDQTLKDIEIVAVNDCSTDRSLEILTNLSKNDSRIKVVNNDKNHGLLYSRAMGILNSSGEYLLNLDPDDMINGQDTLEFLYNKAKFDNIDIISFNVLDQKHKLKKKYYFQHMKILKIKYIMVNGIISKIIFGIFW